MAWYRSKSSNSAKDPVSIIVCAKNEAANLQKNLPALLEQDYPNFEVIVVDDGSQDDTHVVLHDLSKKYKNLRFTAITEDRKFDHGKKLAVTVGIKAAKNELLLFTDADCWPTSDKWLELMKQNYNEQIELVLGYGGYARRKGLLNLIIRFDTMWIAIQYLGYALAGVPYMGVGRNLSYRKSLFFSNKGFARHGHLLSGDDDLFVNEVANASNTKVELRAEAHTVSEPKRTWSGWFRQKKRHFGTYKMYKTKDKLRIGFELFSRFGFYFLFVFLVANSVWLEPVLALFGVRFLVHIILIRKAMTRLKEKDLLLFSPIFDILLPILYIFISLSIRLTGKNTRWK